MRNGGVPPRTRAPNWGQSLVSRSVSFAVWKRTLLPFVSGSVEVPGLVWQRWRREKFCFFQESSRNFAIVQPVACWLYWLNSPCSQREEDYFCMCDYLLTALQPIGISGRLSCRHCFTTPSAFHPVSSLATSIVGLKWEENKIRFAIINTRLPSGERKWARDSSFPQRSMFRLGSLIYHVVLVRRQAPVYW